MLVLFNKPYGVLSQFTSDGGRWKTLAEFIDVPNVYAAGRLDADSEGLLALTDNGALQAAIAGARKSQGAVHGSTSSPRTAGTAAREQERIAKIYWAQVEGIATDDHASQLVRGVRLNDGDAHAINCKLLDDIEEPWPRDPPIRFRKDIPTSWIELTLDEGRNRQVRRMTAAVGLPTLRLIRVAIGPWRVDAIARGRYVTMSDHEAFAQLSPAQPHDGSYAERENN
jgi:23S rRNA pseudouridine2457 synthase